MTEVRVRLLVVAVVAVLNGCGKVRPHASADGPTDDAMDASTPDAATPDATSLDTAPADLTTSEDATTDIVATDTATTDTATTDIATTDTATTDTATTDIATTDTATTDTATTDVAIADTASGDAADGRVATDLAADVAAETMRAPDAGVGDATDATGATDRADALATDGPAGDASDAAGPTATLFLSHARNAAIYRYRLAPQRDPVLTATIPATGAVGLTMSPAGELFAASQNGDILRFATPLATPTPNGKLTGLPITSPQEIAFVDGELWIPSTDPTSCTTAPSEVIRVAFDAGGDYLNGGFGGDGIYMAGRGLLWYAPSRTLYVSDCHAVDAIYPYRISATLGVTDLAPVLGGVLDDPRGMAFSSWGELFVSNAGANEIVRFTVGAGGALVANGKLSGNGLDVPVGLAFAPWGELYVVDRGSASLSRFTFGAGDAGHAASPNGTFATGLDATGLDGSAPSHDLAWMLLVPGS